MAHEVPSSNATQRAPAGKVAPALPVVERLEYRIPGNAAEPVQQNTAHGLQSLVEEWLHPAARERATPDTSTSIAPSMTLAEEQWQKERADLESRLADQRNAANHAVATARAEGFREGRQDAESAFAEERMQLQQQIAEALEQFRQERQRYFHSVEREVVRLSLAIAARVLHRQAQMDSLFLAGAVRVALDKLSDTSGTVLRVPPAEVASWRQLFHEQGNARSQPEIAADNALQRGECVLETRLGTVELGIQAQLEEIEKGFFDLLHHHPAADRFGSSMGTPSIA